MVRAHLEKVQADRAAPVPDAAAPEGEDQAEMGEEAERTDDDVVPDID